MSDKLQPDRNSSQPIVEISLGKVVRTVFAQRQKVFKITAATTIVAIALAFALPKKYEATTTILPPQQNMSLANLLMGGLGGSLSGLAGGGLSLKNPNDMYAGLFRTEAVVDGVIKAVDLQAIYHEKRLSDTRLRLAKNTAIDSSGKDNLIHITVTDRSPERAAEIANQYIKQYRLLSSHLALTEGGQRRKFFEAQLAENKENLMQAEEALRQQQQTSGILEPTAQGQVLIQSAAQIRAQIVAKEVALRGMETYATDQNAAVQQLREEIAGLNAQLARLLKGSKADDDLLTQAKAPKAALEYARKLRDVKYYQSVFEFLSKEAEVARLDEARENTIIQVVDVAMPPDKKSSPRSLLLTILGFLLGLVGSITYLAFGAVREQYLKAIEPSYDSAFPQQQA